MEYGEASEDAVRREMREELGVEVSDARYVGAFESLGTTSEGFLSHGMSLVYEVATDDEAFYRQETVVVDDTAATFPAVWRRIAELVADEAAVGAGLRRVLGSMMGWPGEHIRIRACGVFRRDDEVLLIREYNDAGVARYWAPGGGVDYGEPVEDAVRREMREEVGVEVSDARYIGMFESLGDTPDGHLAHAISLVYEVATEDEHIYGQDVVPIEDNGLPFAAVWIRPADVPAGTWDVAGGLPEALASMPDDALDRRRRDAHT
ncbi:hypothetical protein CMK11_16110 [Candidatus Poribacteria bacterium]|nr:hypothetical protein [Candidatus Poribacteria bacterium]